MPLNLQWARALIAERKYQSAQKVLLNLPSATRNSSAEFHQLMVQLGALEGDFALAQEYLTQLEQLVHNPAEVAFWRAQMIAAQGDWSGAQTLLKQWLEQKPQDQEAWVLLGQIALTANQLEDAEGHLTKALSLGAQWRHVKCRQSAGIKFINGSTNAGRSSEELTIIKNARRGEPGRRRCTTEI